MAEVHLGTQVQRRILEALKTLTRTGASAIKLTDVLDLNGGMKLGGTSVDATAAELNRKCDVSTRKVSLTAATVAVAEVTHESKLNVLNKADGQDLTLPAATGGGAVYEFIVGTTITSVGTNFLVTGNDTMKGVVFGLDGDGVPANAWAAQTGNNKFTMDGSTQGGIIGDRVVFRDIAADVWQVEAQLQQSGTEATPFSTAA